MGMREKRREKRKEKEAEKKPAVIEEERPRITEQERKTHKPEVIIIEPETKETQEQTAVEETYGALLSPRVPASAQDGFWCAYQALVRS